MQRSHCRKCCLCSMQTSFAFRFNGHHGALTSQEVKAAKAHLETSMSIVPGFESLFSFSKARIGYSGVMTCCRLASANPHHASENLVLPDSPDADLDLEGRVLLTQHGPVSVINVYCPRSGCREDGGADRLEFKWRFHNALSQLATSELSKGRHVILLGDFNVAHTAKDSVYWSSDRETTFSAWMDSLVGPGGPFVDAFRRLHPNDETGFTCWDSRTGAREKNYGSRIDYVLIDRDLASRCLTSCVIRQDVMGSDHCPVEVELDGISLSVSATPPPLASSLWDRYRSQASILAFATKRGAELAEEKSSSRTVPAKKQKGQLSLSSFFAKTPKETIAEAPSAPPGLPDDLNDIALGEPDSGTSASESDRTSKEALARSWSDLFQSRKAKWPNCTGHNEPCVLKVVKKKGPNCGRAFYMCKRPEGRPEDSNARCKYFLWSAAMEHDRR